MSKRVLWGVCYFGCGVVGAALVLLVVTLWQDHNRVTAMWNALTQPRPQQTAPAVPSR